LLSKPKLCIVLPITKYLLLGNAFMPDSPYLFRDTLLKLIQPDNLPFEKLTASE